MTHVGYIAVAYVSVIGSVAAYAIWVARRGRRLSQAVPPEDRRWS